MARSQLSIKSVVHWLETTEQPRVVQAPSDVDGIREAWLTNHDRKWIDLDGRQMQDSLSAYNALIEAFGLPDYFGKNLNALKDCLTDQEILRGAAFVICIAHTSEALVAANSDALLGLLETFAVVGDELAGPVADNQPWDRPSIPFHVLLIDVGSDYRLQGYSQIAIASPRTE